MVLKCCRITQFDHYKGDNNSLVIFVPLCPIIHHWKLLMGIAYTEILKW